MLRYDLAIDGDIMGCISESMINTQNQELIEGIKYLQAYYPEFDASNRFHRTLYTFDLIEKALRLAGIDGFIDNILEIIVFDALIGNGDRHQENWALITKKQLLSEVFPAVIKPHTASQKAILKLIKSKEEKIKAAGQELPPEFYITEHAFAPVYDSGSSLARELLPDKVERLLSSENELKHYVTNGTSEIHWENKKVSHFQLINNLLATSHKSRLTNIIERVNQKFNGEKIEQQISEIDAEVPETHAEYKIPIFRKQLINKIITLRFEMIRFIHERV